MKRGALFALAGAVGLCSLHAHAVSESGQRYIDQLTRGGPVSIREGAQNIYHTSNTEQEVLDVAAEVLAQKYRTATDRGWIDAMAWICRALGASGNGRYKAVVAQAAKDGPHRSIKGHCGKAEDALPAATAGSYQPGSVNLQRYQAGQSGAAPATRAAPVAAAAPAPAAAQGSGSLAAVREGMSLDEVNAIMGPPTGTYSHETGKRWRPFNFKGEDVHRIVHLYKGKGRIVFSQDSAYTTVWRVREVLSDPNETGYP
jgi:hypothetical protein